MELTYPPLKVAGKMNFRTSLGGIYDRSHEGILWVDFKILAKQKANNLKPRTIATSGTLTFRAHISSRREGYFSTRKKPMAFAMTKGVNTGGFGSHSVAS